MSSKVVLITGAAQRIGAHIALACARAGWRVALHYRHSDAAAQATRLSLPIAPDANSAAHDTMTFHACFAADFSDPTQTAEQIANDLTQAVIKKMGRLDALVNNASLFELDNLADFSSTRLDRHMRVNVSVPLALARALHQALESRRTGADTPLPSACVVNLLDQKLANPNPDFLSYSLSKAALQYATTVLAQALAPRVRVCAVAPGMSLPSTYQTAENFHAAQRYSLLGAASTPEDIAQAVLFLLNTASITGSCITVDAGQHLSPSGRDVMFLA